MTTRILAPLDDSRWSNAALDLAIWIGEQAKSLRKPENSQVELEALHVVGVTQVSGRWIEDLSGLLGFEPVVVPQQVEAFYRERGQKMLDAVMDRCKHAGIPAQATLETGNVVETICARGAGADLIVMGLRGETEERFPGQGGGTTERVVRHAPVSTLVVPSAMKKIHAIALGYDGSEGSRRALRAAAHLAELVGVEVHAIAVSTPEESFVEVERQLGACNVKVHTHHVEGEPQETLPNEAARHGCDVLILGYRGKSALKDIFLGRTTEWLVGQVDMGILVAR